MKKIALLFVLLCPALIAQNWTAVSASNITDAAGNKLAAGQVCFLGTDQNNIPINFGIGGGGQVLKRPVCATVTNGTIAAGFQVPNPANTSPKGVLYRIWITDTSTGQQVLQYTTVSFQGSAFDLDNYQPSSTTVPAPPQPTNVTGPLNVSGDISATGIVSATQIGSATAPASDVYSQVNGDILDASLYCQTPGVLDQTCINAAGVAAQSDQKNVYIPAGSYSISAQVVFKSGVTYVGAGQGLTILREASGVNLAYPFVTDANATNVQIRDLTIDGNAANNTGGGQVDLLNMQGVSSSSLIRVTVQNWYGYTGSSGPCINFSGVTTDNLVEGNHILNCGGSGRLADGIYIGGTRNRVIGNLIDSAQDTGIVAEYGIDEQITGNVIRNTSQPIAVDGLIASSTAQGVCVCGNTIDGANATNGAAIYIINAAGSQTQRIAVTGNVIYSTTDGDGISVDKSSRILVANNVLSSISPSQSLYKHGIAATDSDLLDVNGNLVEGASGSGIVLNGVTNVLLIGNQTIGNGLVNGDGIVVEDGSQLAVSSLTHASGVCTATLSAGATLAVGDVVTIAGATGDSACNGQYAIASVPSTTQFTYAVAGSGTPTGTITATRNSSGVSIFGNQANGKYQSYGLLLTGGSTAVFVASNELTGNSNNPGLYNSATGVVRLGINHTDNSSAYATETVTGGLSLANGPLVLDNNNSLESRTSAGAPVNLLRLTNDANNITRFFAGNDTGGFGWTNQGATATWMALTGTALDDHTGILSMDAIGSCSGAAAGLNVLCSYNGGYLASSYNGGSFLQLSQTAANGVASLGTAAVGPGACAPVVTVAAAAAATSDSIAWSFNAAPGSGWSSLTVLPYLTAGNVNFLVCNPSAVSVTPTSATINWRVMR